MTFKEWIFSSYPNPEINGQWGLLHIATLVVCITAIVVIALLLKNKSEKAKRIVLWVLVSLIFMFELTRRIIGFILMTNFHIRDVLYILLPRPWCAISCWALMISVVVNKKWLYNFASFSSLLCAIIFFAYPGVGFNNVYMLFENVYSICTHALLLITSITLITLKFTKFEYKTIWKDLICLAVVILYTFIEIYLLKIESDPMYFMPNGDVQSILGVSYPLYLTIYLVFMFVYINLFYLIGDRQNVKNFFAKFKKEKPTIDNASSIEK